MADYEAKYDGNGKDYDSPPRKPSGSRGDADNQNDSKSRKKFTGGSSSLTFSIKPSDYLNSLQPPAAIKKVKLLRPSKRCLLTLPWDQRLRLLLEQGPLVHKFSALKHYPPDEPAETVLRGLRELAIVRSTCKDSKFKEPADVSFMKNYPGIVEEQQREWKMNEGQMREKIGLMKNPMKPDISGKPHPSMLSDGIPVMLAETRIALPKVLRKLFQTHKVCSFQTICQGLLDMAASRSGLPNVEARATLAAAYGVDGPQEELEEVICEVAVNIHGVFVLKSSLEHPEHNPLRNVVIDLFIGKGPHAKVEESEIFEAAKMQLQRESSNDEVRKVLNEFCVSNGSAWELKSGDGAPKKQCLCQVVAESEPGQMAGQI